jgi:hypothetical protein
VTLQTTVESLRAIPSLELVLARAVQIGFGAGVGMDIFQTIPRDPGPSVDLGPSKTLVDPLLVGQLVARVHLLSRLSLIAGAEVDFDFGSHRYTTVDAGGGATAVLDPWLVRPSAMVGLCVPLEGAASCARPE